jgi:hypothetical protein
MLNSYYVPLCRVELPFNRRQVYMHSFDIGFPVFPIELEDYAEPVKALLRAATVRSGTAHMTVDEKHVAAGASQRRPGPHVDGCYRPGAPNPRYAGAPGSWGSGGGGGGWLHNCNNVAAERPGRMPVIVAASVPGCRVWTGKFDGEPRDDGDLEHIRDQLGDGEVLEAGVGYLLSADCVHESMLMDRGVDRTFLRIALPVGFALAAQEGT